MGQVEEGHLDRDGSNRSAPHSKQRSHDNPRRMRTDKFGRLFGGKSSDWSSEMSSELLATYAGLGTHDGEHYYKGEECLGTPLLPH